MALSHVLQEERLIFGQTLKVWFEQNNWPQKITETWAKAYGSDHGPWGSQINQCMPPEPSVDPKPLFFAALGKFNEDLVDSNFELIEDEKSRELLKQGQPLSYDSGLPFLASDFFALFIGECLAPKKYQ